VRVDRGGGAGDRVPEAAEWFRRGWENGRKDCKIELGKLLVAEHWYEIAAGAGHPAAQWDLALLCKRQRRYEEAERWFRQVGEDDEDVVAQLDRIAAIREGGGVAPGKDLRRLPGLSERAEAGDVHASYAYGKILRDWAGAADRHVLRWIEPAAQAGAPEAAYDLAELYNSLRRPALRDHWYRIAAEAGHHDATTYAPATARTT
jgi:TPR repeat protein